MYISDLLCEHLGDHSLVGRPGVLQSERHHLIAKNPSWCNKRHFFLVCWTQRYLVISLEGIWEAHPLMTGGCINKLVDLRQREWVLGTGLV
jgi:hypothetical protein